MAGAICVIVGEMNTALLATQDSDFESAVFHRGLMSSYTLG